MPMACVISRFCSVSSHGRVYAAGAGSIGGEQRNGHIIGLADILEVGGQVGQIGSVILQQSEILAGAGQSAAAIVGRAHVAAQERGRRTGAGGGMRHDRFRIDAMGLRIIILVDQHADAEWSSYPDPRHATD